MSVHGTAARAAALVPAGTLAVPFRGARAAAGPPTLAQRNDLRWMRKENDPFSAILYWRLELPPGATLESLGAALSALVSRYESLRTSWPGAADRSTPLGGLRQVVARSGVLGADLYQLTEDLGADQLTDLLEAKLRADGVDYCDALPLRVAIALRGDEPQCAGAVYAHCAVDFASEALVGGQFTVLAGGGTPEGWDEPVFQPLDQAEAERSARGRRQAEASVRYWEQAIRSAPQAMYPMPRPAGPERSGNATCYMCSPAGGRALERIAARTRVGGQAVLTTAIFAALAERTGLRRAVFAAGSGNRNRPRLHGYVGALAQDSLMVLDFDTGGPGFDAMLKQAAKSTLAAITHSMFDAEELWAALDAVGLERGVLFSRDVAVNFLSTFLVGMFEPGAQAGAADDAPGLTSLTSLTWMDSPPFPVALRFQVPKLSPDLLLFAVTDFAFATRADVEALLHGIERLLLAAAEGDVPLDLIGEITGLEPVARDADWALVDHCRVQLSEVRALVAGVLGAEPDRVLVQVEAAEATGGAAARLVCHAPAPAAPAAPPLLSELHAACVKALPGRPTAMAPGYYVLCDSSPADPRDAAAWAALPVIAEGTGR